jgi:hypothetical protein
VFPKNRILTAAHGKKEAAADMSAAAQTIVLSRFADADHFGVSLLPT